MRPQYMGAWDGSCWLGSETTYITRTPILDEKLTQIGCGAHQEIAGAREGASALSWGG